MQILVTGVTGFVGKHLVRSWRHQLPKAEIWGVLRAPEEHGLPLHGHLMIDLCDSTAVQQLARQCSFDWVVHLAAQSFVPEALTHPEATWQVNFWGTFHLLEALRVSGFKGRLLFVGSGTEYGRVTEDNLPVKEYHPLRPVNPYAASKAAAELLCYQYTQSYHLDIVLARPFNHIGPGQSPRFAVSNFAHQIAKIELGHQEPVLTVGNLEVARDFLDVRDVVDAYRCLLERGLTGEAYNVSSATEIRLTDILATLMRYASCPIEIRTDPARLRSTDDMSRVCGSHEKLTVQTGWTPRKVITDVLGEIVQYWRKELQA